MLQHHSLPHFLAVLAAFLCVATMPLPLSAQAQTAVADKQQETLKRWEAGQKVTEESIEKWGIDRCFTVEPISDAVFQRIYGRSFKKGCTVARAQLRYLKVLHYNLNGEILLGEMVCHKDISADLIDIFRRLFNARYPIERMVLIDEYNADDETSMRANNTSCFNFRTVAGSKRLSKHSLGKAVDINPFYNPYVKTHSNGTTSVRPKGAERYANRTKDFDYKITPNDLCYKEFIRHGFTWGGNWRTMKDYQHFEKK
jgi:hypothetical protein